MTKVNLWPLTMSEQDIPAMFPSSKALPSSPTSRRVQPREPHMPSMGSLSQSMPERFLTVHSYELPSATARMMEPSPIMVQLKAITEEKPPEDTPAMPIPPKPPHSTACAETVTITAPCQTTAAMLTPLGTTRERQRGRMRDSHHSPPQAGPLDAKELGRNERSSPSSTDTQRPRLTTNSRSKNCILPPSHSRKQATTAEEQHRAAIKPNAQAIREQRQRWEQLREFYASLPLWPTDIPTQGIDRGSPLIRTMFYPLSDTTRISTYAWNGHGDTLSGTVSPNDPETERLPCLSQSRWNTRADSGWAELSTSANLFRYSRRLTALAKTKLWPSPETPINFQRSLSPQRQWERMRVFHSRKLLWPTMERTGQTQVAGGLPLTWTTLYLP